MPMRARLLMAGKTQRWMLEKLHENGFPNLVESTLSDINSKKYKVGCAADVLKAEEKILKEVKEAS